MVTLERVLLLQLENKLTTNNDWYALSMHKLSEEVIRKYIDKLFMKELCKRNVIPEDIIIKYIDDPVIMNHLIITQTLSDKMKLKILNYKLEYLLEPNARVLKRSYSHNLLTYYIKW